MEQHAVPLRGRLTPSSLARALSPDRSVLARRRLSEEPSPLRLQQEDQNATTVNEAAVPAFHAKALASAVVEVESDDVADARLVAEKAAWRRALSPSFGDEETDRGDDYSPEHFKWGILSPRDQPELRPDTMPAFDPANPPLPAAMLALMREQHMAEKADLGEELLSCVGDSSNRVPSSQPSVQLPPALLCRAISPLSRATSPLPTITDSEQ